MIGIGGYVGLFDDPNTFRRLDNCQHFVDVAVDENNNDDDFDDHPVKKNFQGKVKASRLKETYTNTYK